MSDKLKEEIKYYTEWLRFIIVGLMAICSSIYTLIINEVKTITALVFVILGTLLIFGTGIGIIFVNDKIRNKLKNL